MKFCSDCGAPVALRIADGDQIPRFTCTRCARVHYQNPRILVTCLATYGLSALWMKRAHAPRIGCWSVPGGYMEEGESLQEAAVRELFEETRVLLKPESLFLYGIGTIRHVNQVYVSFRADLPSAEFGPTAEASEVALFNVDELPWHELAFPQLTASIRNFYHELENREFKVYLGDYHNGGGSFREA